MGAWGQAWVPLEQREPPTEVEAAGGPLPWREWLEQHFRHVCTAPMPEGGRHVRLWEWFERLRLGEPQRARVDIWPRGGAKSSTCELGCCWVGVRLARRFVLYVSGTQEQADKHVAEIADLFEEIGIGRALNTYGHSKGWRRNQLRTENGFNVAAFGLDSAARGAKLGQYRPDLIILDDVDDRHDTPKTVKKKIRTITTSLLPAGSGDCAVVFVQNRIHRDSIASQLADGRADFLRDREPVTEEPAVRGLKYEQREASDGTLRWHITAGEPTWAGQDLATCARQMNAWGLSAFLAEAQHETDEGEGGLWKRDWIDQVRRMELPDLVRIAAAVDPNTKEGGDEAGVIVAGVAREQGVLHGFVVDDATAEGGPKVWSEAAVAAYRKWRADALVAESNNGGEMVEITIQTVEGAPPVTLIHASRGKLTRAEPIAKLYQDGRVHHVGHFPDLERQLCTYRPAAGMPSPGRMDALVWALTYLMLPEDENPLAGLVMQGAAKGWMPVL